jgi:hypothetical protein
MRIEGVDTGDVSLGLLFVESVVSQLQRVAVVNKTKKTTCEHKQTERENVYRYNGIMYKRINMRERERE